MFVYPGGRITVTNYTLKMLIHESYGIPEFRILGGPKWAGEDRFSIVAKPPANSKSANVTPANPKLPPPVEELLMVRALLTDRFRLIVHEETKEGPMLVLVVGSQGAKLTAARNKDAFPVVGYGRTGVAERPDFMHGENASMGLFAKRLSVDIERPVLDQTALNGTFDFEFEYARNLSESAEGPSLFGAIQQLGLKLIPKKGPVLHLVIDHAEKPAVN